MATLAIWLLGAGLQAQSGPPAYKKLRYDEDFSFLRDPAKRSDYLDPIKFVPLDASGGDWLSFGGEIRVRYENFHHSLWGQGPQDDNGFIVQRSMIHADWHVNEAVRFFTQLKSGLEDGRVGGPRPTDEDRLDLNQAFLDVNLPVAAGNALTWRFGRQEMAFGSSRLVSFRESPNVRRGFDGVRGTWRAGQWQVDGFAVEPVQTKPGTFDDGSDRTQKFWGIYAVTPFPAVADGHFDFYYLDLTRDSARFDQGTAREERHTSGLRLWGHASGWDYNFEALYQFGKFGSDTIAAWSVASDTGYAFSAPLKPRVGLKADIVSGDRDPNDGTLGTFNALFPKGAYFNESGLIGPANLIDLHPSVDFKPWPKVKLSVDCDFLWRESLHDGIYGPAVNLVRSGLNATARYIGSQPSVLAEWQPSRHWTLATTYAHFFAGDFIRQSGPGSDVDYFSSWITYLF